LLTFVGPCPDGQEALHLNDDPMDNRRDNLEWGTRSKNQQQWRRREGSKLNETAVRWIRANRGVESLSATAERFGVTKGMIWLVREGRAWKHVQ
jgi:hypothetical protein